MKRIYIVLILSVLACSLSAQRLGVDAAFQLAYGAQSIDNDLVEFNAAPGAGFAAGLLFDFDLTNRWGVDAGVYYNLRTLNYDMFYSAEPHIRLQRELFFLNIPLHAYVNFPTKKVTMSLYFGPSFNVGLHGTDKAWENTDWQKPVMLKDEELFGDDGHLKRFEIAAEIGLRAKYRQFVWAIGYHHGLNNLNKNNFAWTFALPTGTESYVTMGEVKLSFAYMWELRR